MAFTTCTVPQPQQSLFSDLPPPLMVSGETLRESPYTLAGLQETQARTVRSSGLLAAQANPCDLAATKDDDQQVEERQVEG